MTKYKPSPKELSQVELPAELQDLTEQMARNVHEVWAASRMELGWEYGSRRNDELKQHPCLVPYDELPESEKEFDRNTSIETLKLIISLGFKITKE